MGEKKGVSLKTPGAEKEGIVVGDRRSGFGKEKLKNSASLQWSAAAGFDSLRVRRSI